MSATLVNPIHFQTPPAILWHPHKTKPRSSFETLVCFELSRSCTSRLTLLSNSSHYQLLSLSSFHQLFNDKSKILLPFYLSHLDPSPLPYTSHHRSPFVCLQPHPCSSPACVNTARYIRFQRPDNFCFN